MIMAIDQILIALSILPSAMSAPQSSPPSSSIRVLYQFPPNTPVPWVEKLAQRSNNDLLLTRLHVPELWSVNPSNGRASLVKAFPVDTTAPETALQAIVEYAPDQFAVNYVLFQPSPAVPLGGVPGKQAIYTIDLRDRQKKTRYFAIPEASWLNGITVAIRGGRSRDANAESSDLQDAEVPDDTTTATGPSHHR